MDWVKFDAQVARDGSIDPVDKALYAALCSFVPVDGRTTSDAPDGEDVPTREVLAACIGRSVDTVDRSTKRLEKIGLIRVLRRRDPANPKVHLPSVYKLRDHEWWDERAARRAQARREAAERSAQAEDAGHEGGRTGAARGGRMDAARGSSTDAARGGRTGAAHSFVRGGSKTPPSSPPSHTGSASAGAGQGEGEGSPEGTASPPAGAGSAVPSPRAAADDGRAAGAVDGQALEGARRLLERLPAPVTPGARTVRDLAPAVAAALAAGWTPETLTARLTADLPATVHSERALLTHRLEDLPPAPPAASPVSAPRPARCEDSRHRHDHPEMDRFLYDGDTPIGLCPTCGTKPTTVSASEGHSR